VHRIVLRTWGYFSSLGKAVYLSWWYLT